MSNHTLSRSLNLQGRKILVVDDDRLNIRILKGILQPEGYTLAEAESGEQALEVYANFLPDLVLLDVILPGIDGFAACVELRKRYAEAAAPVIFITAKSESEDIVAGLTAGGVDYLPKPFRAKEVVARIRTHLQSRLLLEQLSQANEAKNRFLGMAAHDLRNPLASIRGLAEFLEDPSIGDLNIEQRDLVGTIRETSQSMLRLVNELLDVATIEAGELKVQLAPCKLEDVVTKCAYLANMEAARKSTLVEVQPLPKLEPISADEAKIKQVIENLLSNAIKYSPPGSNVRIGLRVAEREAVVSVYDQGPGIPDKERHRLFKDFGRLSTKPTGGEKSTGLGLAICHKIVDAHRGSIDAHNLPDRGCEFRVTLPLA